MNKSGSAKLEVLIASEKAGKDGYFSGKKQNNADNQNSLRKAQNRAQKPVESFCKRNE